MDIKAIIASVADQADDILQDAANRKDARAAIGDFLTARHPSLSGVDRLKITDGVMQILEEEDFFAAGPGGEWTEGEESDDEA